MLIKKGGAIPYSEITPESLYLRRREFIQAASGVALGTAAAIMSPLSTRVSAQGNLAKLPNVKKSPLSTTEAPNGYDDITSYNNFYEFGPEKEDPKANSGRFQPRPWTIRVEGLVKTPQSYDLDSFIKPYPIEERVYRMRCVEAWSVIVPWAGIPLGDVIKTLQPLPTAKFVEFTTLFDPTRMPGQRIPIIRYPYVEGLRMDEAMHPLAILAVGLYGSVLPNQDGAPIRLVTPWKYGFKGIKSIVKIRFTDTQPVNTWQIAAPREYGFYANVNPMVDHPRWTQATERRLGEFRRRKTEPFNGYADQVASLYSGLDLRKNY
jgi:methionine sulfoxide reductase catalytic subunit